MTAAFWDNAPDAYIQNSDPLDGSEWDVLYLGGDAVPGICEVGGDVFKRELDVKKASGMRGATVTDNGCSLTDLTFTITVWTPAHWIAWVALFARIAPKAARKPSPPLSVEHPALNACGIDKVIIETISVPKRGNVIGSKVIEIKAKLWAKPQVSGSTTAQKAKQGAEKTPPSVLDKADAAWREGYARANPSFVGPPPPPPPSFTDAGPVAK